MGINSLKIEWFVPISGTAVLKGLTLLGPQSRCGGKPLIIRVLCPHIGECGAKGVKRVSQPTGKSEEETKIDQGILINIFIPCRNRYCIPNERTTQTDFFMYFIKRFHTFHPFIHYYQVLKKKRIINKRATDRYDTKKKLAERTPKTFWCIFQL